jgi:hypothetical protein
MNMPGFGHRYEWIGEPPLYWTVIAVAMMGNVAVSLILSYTLPRWARSIPDASHPIELRMKGGHLYYLSPGMGWYMNHDLWITFGLLGILALIMFIHRNKVERVR